MSDVRFRFRVRIRSAAAAAFFFFAEEHESLCRRQAPSLFVTAVPKLLFARATYVVAHEV